MIDAEFSFKAEKIIDELAKIIEDSDPEGMIDLDINAGIMTLGTNHGVFVINKQSAAKEIWLSSPISGPYHFAPQKEGWVSRDGSDLFEVLSKELQVSIDIEE